MIQVISEFFCIKPELFRPELSLTLKCYECLNITIKRCNAFVTEWILFSKIRYFGAKQIKYVVNELQGCLLLPIPQ